MRVNFLLFARARELAGTASYEADLPEGRSLLSAAENENHPLSGLMESTSAGCKAHEAMQKVLEEYPALKQIEGEGAATPHHHLTTAMTCMRLKGLESRLDTSLQLQDAVSWP